MNHFDNRKLQIRCLKNAVVVPGGPQGGGIVHDGYYLDEAMVHRGWHPVEYQKTPNEVSVCHESVVFLGEFYSCWGHCLTDGLKFAWAFLPGKLKKWTDDDVRFVYVSNSPEEKLYENFIRLWEIIGVRRDQMIRVERATCFDHVYLPDESYYLDLDRDARFYTAEYKQTIDYIKSQVVSNLKMPSRDIFFSRTQWHTSKPDFGERQLESAIANAIHCECVSPEALTVEDMIRLLSECKRLITTEGSLAHNSIFLRDGSELVILTKADYENGYQPPINQMQNLKMQKIRAHASKCLLFPDSPWLGPFFLCVTHELGDYLGVRPQFPKIEFIRYFMFSEVRRIRFYGSLFLRTVLKRLSSNLYGARHG